MRVSEIKELSNEMLILKLIREYCKTRGSIGAKKEAQKVAKELKRRGIIENDEDFIEKWCMAENWKLWMQWEV